jgi:uncharacterized Ntn-hydrolase superfamily protein
MSKMTRVEVNTYSLVGRCARTGELGACVASAVPAVGAICLVSRSGVGLACTQSWVNPYLARDALDQMEAGAEAGVALSAVIASDPAHAFRQIGAIGISGPGAAFTGGECTQWCGQRCGADYTVQGNMLTGPETLDAMVAAFEAEPDVALEERLMRALEAAQAVGGDKRGRQSAALLVTNAEAYARVDLRVDEHADPVAALRRVLTVASAQLAPFVAGMPRRGTAAPPPDPAVTLMLLKSPPDRPGGGGARNPLHAASTDGALDPAILLGLNLPPERLRELAENFSEIRAEIDKLRSIDLADIQPAVVFTPELKR